VAMGAQEAGGSRRLLVGVNPMLTAAGAARLAGGGGGARAARGAAAAHEVHFSVDVPEALEHRAGPVRGQSVRHHMEGAVARGRERFQGGML
jgi:hypothetical protein